mmetsp:Transcript_48558/g.137282  ORF Transcript_48558/g.137282 Transcript_48558/m.137282 type:complete len:256 (-) Transcript_48558:520-1287(-)
MFARPCESKSLILRTVACESVSISLSFHSPSFANAQAVFARFCVAKSLICAITSMRISSMRSLSGRPSVAKAQAVLARSCGIRSLTMVTIFLPIAPIIMAFATPSLAKAQLVFERSWLPKSSILAMISHEISSMSLSCLMRAVAKDQEVRERSWGFMSCTFLTTASAMDAIVSSALACILAIPHARLQSSRVLKRSMIFIACAFTFSIRSSFLIASFPNACTRFAQHWGSNFSIRSCTAHAKAVKSFSFGWPTAA